MKQITMCAASYSTDMWNDKRVGALDFLLWTDCIKKILFVRCDQHWDSHDLPPLQKLWLSTFPRLFHFISVTFHQDSKGQIKWVLCGSQWKHPCYKTRVIKYLHLWFLFSKFPYSQIRQAGLMSLSLWEERTQRRKIENLFWCLVFIIQSEHEGSCT